MKDEFVMVPRDELEAACKRFAKAQIFDFSRRMRALLDKPAEQPQGEPVAVLYADGHVLTKADCGDVFEICCKVETPLYTRPVQGDPTAHSLAEKVREALDRQACPNAWMVIAYEAVVQNFTHAEPAEVERLRKELEETVSDLERVAGERDAIAEVLAIRVKELAERNALLRKFPDMPKSVERRLFDDADPDGYLEGDGDWCDNNPEVVAWLIENHAAIRAALSASAEPRAEVKNMRLLVKREGVGVYYLEQSNPANFAGHSFNKLVVPTGFRVRFETGEIHVSKCADREQVERADFDTWFNEQKLCKGSTYLNNFKLERRGEFVSIPELMFEAFQLGAKQGVKS